MSGKFDAMVTIFNWLGSGRTISPQTIMEELGVSARSTYMSLIGNLYNLAIFGIVCRNNHHFFRKTQQ